MVAKEVTAELQPRIEYERSQKEYWEEEYWKVVAARCFEENLRKEAERARDSWRIATFIGIPSGVGFGFLAAFLSTKAP
jgi:hypothetical protein